LFVLLKATEVLPMILGRASALKQVANNIMMQTGSLIACACVVCAQNRLTILSSPTAGTDERLGGSHAETPAERIPTASPWR
jgi:pyrimidine deaminase RibD-like protein